jgi:hypothetical protein
VGEDPVAALWQIAEAERRQQEQRAAERQKRQQAEQRRLLAEAERAFEDVAELAEQTGALRPLPPDRHGDAQSELERLRAEHQGLQALRAWQAQQSREADEAKLSNRLRRAVRG